MPDHRKHTRRLILEDLETRLVMSAGTPANVIGTSAGVVTTSGQVSRTSVPVVPENITPKKHATLFGLFVQPSTGSPIRPKITGAAGTTGAALPIKRGRPFRPGVSTETVAFVKDFRAGQLSTDVTGRYQTTGAYQSRTTLLGDVNGDGKVNLADLQAFAPSYMATIGEPNYNPAADFNHNGIINLYDAKVLMHNLTPLTPRQPLSVRLILAPQDQIHYSGPSISGAATFQKTVTILGHTTPGSLVIEDNHTSRLPGGTQAYKFTGQAHATDANGFFSITATNTEGLNNNDFLILDPFGQQRIIDFPIFWIPYATGKGAPT